MRAKKKFTISRFISIICQHISLQRQFPETIKFNRCKICKPRPNDHNMPTQHIPTLLGATCCVRLATYCCNMLAVVGSVLTIFKLEPTIANMSQRGGQRKQHVAPNNVAICYVGMLRSFGRGFTFAFKSRDKYFHIS